MLRNIFEMFLALLGGFKFLLYPILAIIVVFFLLVWFWTIYYKLKGYKKPRHNYGVYKRSGLIRSLFLEVPRRFVLDKFNRKPDTFMEKGIHIFCGEQGSGKTISCVEYMLRLQTIYKYSKTITNFGLVTEDDELKDWRQLIEYNNSHLGVIVGIDEIQNWFMSGKIPFQFL